MTKGDVSTEGQSGIGYTNAILESALDSVIVIDHEGTVLAFNRAAERTFGYLRDDVIGKEMAPLLIPPADRERHRSALARIVAGGSAASKVIGRRVEMTAMRSDGTPFPVELTVTRIPGAGPPRFAGHVRDLSEQREARDELEASLERERNARRQAEEQRFRSRRLVAQALHAEETERNRLAQVIHDGPMQDLGAAGLELKRAGADPEAVARATFAISEAQRRLRDMVFDLHPPAPGRVGMEAALKALATEFGRRADAEVEVVVASEAPGAHDELVFALAREFVSNAVRHAGATRISVRLYRDERELVLEVADDGVGIDEENRLRALLEGHIGLASSEERTAALGGSFEVGRRESGGTLVRATLPARRATDAAKVKTAEAAPPPPDVPERRTLRV